AVAGAASSATTALQHASVHWRRVSQRRLERPAGAQPVLLGEQFGHANRVQPASGAPEWSFDVEFDEPLAQEFRKRRRPPGEKRSQRLELPSRSPVEMAQAVLGAVRVADAQERVEGNDPPGAQDSQPPLLVLARGQRLVERVLGPD